jgi:hypothetical protein
MAWAKPRSAGLPHLAHAARADGSKDFVGSQTSPSGEGPGVDQFYSCVYLQILVNALPFP